MFEVHPEMKAFVKRAAESKFYLERIGDMKKEELLALIGWLQAEWKRAQSEHMESVKFLSDCAKAKG